MELILIFLLIAHFFQASLQRASRTSEVFELTEPCGRNFFSGEPTLKPVSELRARISNGFVAQPHDFPFNVKLEFFGGELNFCHGVVITNNLLLTTARCATSYTKGQVSYHRLDSGENIKFISEIAQKCVSKKFARERRLTNMTGYTHDFAILRIEGKFDFTLENGRRLQPVCLPDLPIPIGNRSYHVAQTTGFGNMAFIPMWVIDCPALERDFDGEVVVDPSILCATPRKQSGGPCRGDWGGGLVWFFPYSPRLSVYGLYSYSYDEKCYKERRTTDVFVNVYNMRDEISELIRECQSS